MTSDVLVPRYAAGGQEPTRVQVVPFESPAAHHPWWTRDDPYYEPELFDAEIRWEYRSRFATELRTTAAGQLRKVKARQPDFKPLPARVHTSRRPLAAIAALGQFHHLTTVQAACLGGWDSTQVGRVLTPLWSGGLLDRAKLVPRDIVGPRAPLVWQLRSGTELRRFQRALDNQRWAAVTLGLDLATSGGRAYVRHNLLAAELMIRSLEVVPTIAGAWGEPLCDPHRLLPPDHPARPDRLAGWRADLCLLREDGFRIVIEVTYGTSEQSIRPKLRRWARLLSRTALSDTGFAVVFLNAAPPGRHEHLAGTLRKLHSEVVSADGLAVDGVPASESVVRRVRSQLFVASWREWFPSLGAISDRGQQLLAAYTPDGETWKYVALAEPDPTHEGLPFTPADPLAWIDAVVNVAMGAHSPQWAGGPTVSTLDLTAAQAG